jgi:hypothetical protein
MAIEPRPVYLSFCYRKTGGKLGISEKVGRERQLRSMPGSGMEGKKNICWRKRDKEEMTHSELMTEGEVE